MIVTVYQLLEAADAVRGESRDALVELTLPGGRTFVGVTTRPDATDGPSFSLPPFPGPAED